MLLRLLVATVLAAAPLSVSRAEEATQVMVVGMFHMSNPGRDLHDIHADDVLAPNRQKEIADVVAGLARFRPTVVDVEWPAPLVSERYAKYLAGTLPPSRNEVVQIGFRLARATHARVFGADVEGDFPYDAVQAYAKAQGESALMANGDAAIVKEVADQQKLLDRGSVGDLLRTMNEPARIRADNAWYMNMLKIGGGAEQPGADLVAAWTKRNLRICANIVQHAKPDDRVVVLFGAGHAFLLRQCVLELPGYRLVEPNAFLPAR